MEARRLPISLLAARTEVRLASFGLAAAGAVYLGFIGVSVSQAETSIKYAGYYVLLLTFVLWLAALRRLWLGRDLRRPAWSRRELCAAGLVVLMFTGVAITHETYRSKILNDEFVLQSTAYNMHYFREVAAMARGYDILGTFVSTDTFLDKRPNFYPFLVSLAHDFTGYRPANAFFVNSALMAVALGLAYHLGRHLSGWRGGMLAVALLGSLPIFAQNATGSGMEMLNLTMLLAVIALAIAYLESPGELRLSAFVVGAVLLAQCRYESMLYVLPVALVVLAGWWRPGRITLSWVAVIAPLLLVPAVLQNKVLSNSPVRWEMKANQTSRFALEYVAGNVEGAVNFLFSFRHREGNSVVLTVLGAAGLIWAVAALVARRKELGRLEPARLAWLFFGLGILANTVLVMFYYWASFSDPMAARFCLPFSFLLVFLGVLFTGWLDRWLPASTVMLFVTAVCFLGFSIPKQSPHHYSRVGIDEIEWQQRVVAARPPGERIVLANNSTIIWLLQKTPSILLNRARMVPDRLRHQLGEAHFREILVTQSLRPTTVEGNHEIIVEDRLPENYHLEILAEKRFGTKIARISRLVAVDADKNSSSP